jgi:hypothetical protein
MSSLLSVNEDESHSDEAHPMSSALVMNNVGEKAYVGGEDDGNHDDLDEELPLTFPQRVSLGIENDESERKMVAYLVRTSILM